MTKQKTRENSARRRCELLGLALRKSRQQHPPRPAYQVLREVGWAENLDSLEALLGKLERGEIEVAS